MYVNDVKKQVLRYKLNPVVMFHIIIRDQEIKSKFLRKYVTKLFGIDTDN